MDQLEPLTIPKVQSSPFSHLSATKTPLSLNVSIYQHVSDVIELAKLTLDDISGRYFQTFHLFLPIIAPSLFYQRASSYREGIPSADFSVLILMCLLTISEPGSMDSASSQELLYATSKSLLLQTQTAICASIPLIQAAFIITVYEYACARPKIAYISLSTCISMARILGLIGSTSLQDEVQDHVNPKIEYLEKSNLSWAIVMLERYSDHCNI